MSGLDILVGASNAYAGYKGAQEHDQDRKNLEAVRDQQSKLGAMQLQTAQLGLDDATRAHGDQAAYRDALAKAPNDDAAAQSVMSEARKRGDFKTYETARDGIIKRKQATLDVAVKRGVQAAMLGDPQPLANAYNTMYPDGNKVNAVRNPDGTFSMEFYGADGK